MQHNRKVAGFFAIMVCALAPPAWAQTDGPMQQAIDQIKAQAVRQVLEPGAVEALTAMSKAVSAQQTFALNTRFQVDIPLEGDQSVAVAGTAKYLVRRPDRFKLELTSDLGERSFLFDGTSFYILSGSDKVYGQLDDVGATIKDVLETVAYHADVELPLADLFDAGTADALEHVVTGGFLVGAAEVDGQPTDHWAFNTADKNFQVWIAKGDNPLPLRLLIENTAEPARPRMEILLDWQPDPVIAATDFDFKPGDATPIPVLLNTEEESQDAQ
jgi:hypothetical protein